MDFKAWLAANNYDESALSDAQRKHLEAAWKLETQPSAPPAVAQSTSFDDTIKAIEAENARIDHIRTATTKAMQSNVGNAEKCKQLRDLCDAAIADKKMDTRAFDLAMLRVDRLLAPMVMTQQAGTQALNDQFLEAAVCRTLGLPKIEKHYPEQVLEATHKRFRRGIGLQELLQIAGERNNGYRGSVRDERALCFAAFRNRGEGYDLMSAGPSTISVPGILSNVANKFLESTFGYGEQSWRQVSRIKSANDFKQMSSYRLAGNLKFQKVAPGGEIKHGSLTELTYTNQVDTYAKQLGIDRRDIINDDLGAFKDATSELGRGAIDSLNEVFWTEWLDDSDFFNTDKSRGNYDDGATDSVLSLAGLDNADSIFAQQTKPDGTPMGVMPKILLVPRGLRATALNLMNGAITASAQSTATITTENVWKGQFDVVSSLYLASSAITGYSATAWYLLADPNNIACIEVAFLNGVETPTVETSEFNFDMLGLAMRAYLDFGINKQEPRGGIKLKGAS